MNLTIWKCQYPYGSLTIVLGILALGLFQIYLPAVAEDTPKHRDIYLTQDRVCRSCTWAWDSNKLVRLTNRQGQATLVHPAEIIGVDRHPILRKITIKSLHGIGLPGPIIVPAAFEDANDYVCKYCDMVGR